MSEHLTCKLCGKRETLCFNAQGNANLKQLQACFNCNFWLGYLEEADRPDIVRCIANRTGGVLTHYVVGEEPTPVSLRSQKSNMYGNSLGHAGGEFRIKFHDGRTIVTHNLWCQGAIPEYFQPFLPANAEFLDEY